MSRDEVAGEGLVHHGSAQATCAICQKLTFNAPNWDGTVTCSMPCTDRWITIHEEKEDHDTAHSDGHDSDYHSRHDGKEIKMLFIYLVAVLLPLVVIFMVFASSRRNE